jgi:hypothetical protein
VRHHRRPPFTCGHDTPDLVGSARGTFDRTARRIQEAP